MNSPVKITSLSPVDAPDEKTEVPGTTPFAVGYIFKTKIYLAVWKELISIDTYNMHNNSLL